MKIKLGSNFSNAGWNEKWIWLQKSVFKKDVTHVLTYFNLVNIAFPITYVHAKFSSSINSTANSNINVA